MNQARLHERLLELPLFQGISRNDLEQIVSSTKFRHLSYGKGKTVVSEGDVCDKTYFLLKGTISATGYADDNGYSITEIMQAPEILQPERIFGLTQRYTRTFKSVTDCTFICLGKKRLWNWRATTRYSGSTCLTLSAPSRNASHVFHGRRSPRTYAAR